MSTEKPGPEKQPEPLARIATVAEENNRRARVLFRITIAREIVLVLGILFLAVLLFVRTASMEGWKIDQTIDNLMGRIAGDPAGPAPEE